MTRLQGIFTAAIAILVGTTDPAFATDMRIFLAQMHVRAGDFNGNLQRAIESLREADRRRADLALFPEGLFPGYPSNDMLTVPDFIERSVRASDTFLDASAHFSPWVVYGSIEPNPRPTGKPLQNFIRVAHDGILKHKQAKVLLPTYGPFDDGRYFAPGKLKGIKVVYIKGKKVVFLICEDGWFYARHNGRLLYDHNTITWVRDLEPDLVVVISASPHNDEKIEERESVHSNVARIAGAPLIWVNQFGVVDHLLFDGTCFGMDKRGNVTFRLPSWKAASAVVLLPDEGGTVRLEDPAEGAPLLPRLERKLQAVITGEREFVRQTGHDAVVFGFSGGLDSTLAAAVSSLAVGPENTFALLMPSDFSSDGSITDSKVLIQNLGIPEENVLTLPIQSTVNAILDTLDLEGIRLDDLMAFDGGRTAVENIQARVRMIFEFFMSNLTQRRTPAIRAIAERLGKENPRWARFLSRKAAKIATNDKSEAALGNGTLAGDIAGVYAVNGDLYKTDLWELGEYINRRAGREVIPEVILKKEPTPELLAGQLATDKFPDYRIVDPILKDFIENRMSPEALREKYAHCDQLVPERFRSPTLVDHLIRMHNASEYKRELAQMPSARASHVAFGKERRVTILVEKGQPFGQAERDACLRELRGDRSN